MIPSITHRYLILGETRSTSIASCGTKAIERATKLTSSVEITRPLAGFDLINGILSVLIA